MLGDTDGLFCTFGDSIVKSKMATMKDLPKGTEEVEMTLEDQQYINTFARRNTKMEELKEQVETKKKHLQNLEDAGDELLMVDDLVLYKVGDVFIQMSQEETDKYLEKAKTKTNEEIECLEEQITEIKKVLSGLKAKLYGKFGDNINLETDDE